MKSIYDYLLEWNHIKSDYPFIYYKRFFKLNDVIHEINSIATFLREIPSQYIGIYMESSIDAIFIYLASIKVKKIPVMLNYFWGNDNLNQVISKYEINHIISSWDKKKKINCTATVYYFEEILNSSKGCGIPSDFNKNIDFESILFTSGTSGDSKAVCLSKKNFLMSSKTWDHELNFKKEDKYILCLPVYHIAGLSIIYRAIYYKFQVQIIDSYRELDKAKGTIISLLPSILNRIINDDQYIKILSSYRAIVLGGEPADKKLLLKCIKLKLNIFISYGMTETCSGVSGFWLHEHPDKLESVGKEFKGVSITEKNGYISIKSDMNMKRYFLQEDSKSNFITSDKGEIKNEFIYIHSRDKSIISGGEKVNLMQIKNTLLKHKAIDNINIKIYKSKQWGQAIEARIVLNQKISKEELKDWCRDKLPKYSIPKKIKFL